MKEIPQTSSYSEHKTHRLLALCVGLAVIGFYLIIVAAGVNSGFIFDDAPNLSPLSSIDQRFSPAFWQFVTSGHSGPTGRPISLLSFALQHADWPHHANRFKWVNVFIHAVNACLVVAVVDQALKYTVASRVQRLWLAVGVGSVWLLHPMHTNTVMYVVQRMVLLAGFFSLLTLVIYL